MMRGLPSGGRRAGESHVEGEPPLPRRGSRVARSRLRSRKAVAAERRAPPPSPALLALISLISTRVRPHFDPLLQTNSQRLSSPVIKHILCSRREGLFPSTCFSLLRLRDCLYLCGSSWRRPFLCRENRSESIVKSKGERVAAVTAGCETNGGHRRRLSFFLPSSLLGIVAVSAFSVADSPSSSS